jgi:curved DNA-binding protein CbpA
MTSPHEFLGLSENATPDEVRKAYRLYVAKFHPDKHNGDPFFEEMFKRTAAAYESLQSSKGATKPNELNERVAVVEKVLLGVLDKIEDLNWWKGQSMEIVDAISKYIIQQGKVNV